MGGLALAVLGLTLSCASPSLPKTGAQLHAAENAAVARHPDNPAGARSCQELRSLARPQGPGLGCVAINGGFVGLLGNKKTESWNDAEWSHQSSVSYDIWALQPRPAAGARNAAGAGKGDAASTAARSDAREPRRLRWPEDDGCMDSEDFGGGSSSTSRCSLSLVHDLDDDGSPEVVLKKEESSSDAGCCTQPATSYKHVFYSIQGDALVPYNQLPSVQFAEDTFAIVDYDHDGRPDFLSYLDYKIPGNCTTFKGFLIHSRAGGERSQDDQVARQAAREYCPQPPTRPLEQVPTKELAQHILCARLWGATTEQLQAALNKRCHAQESVAYDDQGGEHYRFPWQFCYRDGLECDYPEIHGYCGSWVDELAKQTPPFLLTQQPFRR